MDPTGCAACTIVLWARRGVRCVAVPRAHAPYTIACAARCYHTQYIMCTHFYFNQTQTLAWRGEALIILDIPRRDNYAGQHQRHKMVLTGTNQSQERAVRQTDLLREGQHAIHAQINATFGGPLGGFLRPHIDVFVRCGAV